MAETVVQRDSDQDGAKGEGSFAFTITKPIDLAQLGQELAAKMELDTEPGIVASGPLRTATSKNPVTMWIFADVNLTTLRALVNAHEVKANPWDGIVMKAQEGTDYSPEEVQMILRRLVLIGR